MMKYVVIHSFRDVQDNDRIYAVGEEHQGKKTKARITELSNGENQIGVSLIKKIEEIKE